MRHIPWERVLGAIELRDASGLRLLAGTSRCEQRRQLLLVFADIVENGTIVESRREILPRITSQRVRVSSQPPFRAGGEFAAPQEK